MPGQQAPGPHLLGDRLRLIERHRCLARGDQAAARDEDLHLDLAHIRLALLADPDHRDDDFLQRRAAMHEAAARALHAHPVDRVRDQDIQITRQTKACCA